jgi:hypothetical protein
MGFSRNSAKQSLRANSWRWSIRTSQGKLLVWGPALCAWIHTLQKATRQESRIRNSLETDYAQASAKRHSQFI